MKKIVLLTTGGTIAMKKDEVTGGLVPAVSGKDLAAAVPGLASVADVKVEAISNIPSGHMTLQHMWKLSQRIDELAKEDVDGFVVTHGTDTLEETAFFLAITLHTEKPVCVTGAMRGASEISADGPGNILSAVRIAASEEAKGMGVLVSLMDRIYTAWDVTKSHSTNPDTFCDFQYGPIGTVYPKEIIFARRPLTHIKIHPVHVDAKVWILPTWSGMDGEILSCMKSANLDGLVIDSLGCGNVPPKLKEEIMEWGKTDISLLLTTRVTTGSVEEEYSYDGSALSMKEAGLILGGSLPAWKARILLTLALSVSKDKKEVQKLLQGKLH